MSNSGLISFTNISPNRTSPRNRRIDTITPHCVVGQASAEAIGRCFTSPGRKASCNYGIGVDGRIILVVDEKDRSWCSSNSANDHRAVTIECASDKTAPYAMNSKVYDKLIDLCADICRRNGKKRLLWLGSKEKTLAYTPKSDEMLLTAHRWFANKSCPGDWLYSRYGDLADRVNILLNSNISNELQYAITPDRNPFMEPETVVKIGSRGESVKWVQWYLWRFGIMDREEIDGIFGNKTDAAVREAQKRLKLEQDGKVGSETRMAWKKLA